ncbi:MAG: ABC transporter ATP-binding protein, partial [Planctomycetaceae bacterium]|nr:ABC transporter ATP-binding protein [Planctomycetaceae bacterium]
DQIFRDPQHPYTKGLLACRPKLETTNRRLPTVSDFMTASQNADGSYQIVEKKIDAERLKALSFTGRGRLLHPGSELAPAGKDAKCIAEDASPLLSVQNLHLHFPIRKGIFKRQVGEVRAVDGISFDVYQGQTLGLVGESGCGKTTTGRTIVKLLNPTSGEIFYNGTDVTSLYGEELQQYRSNVQIIFQDPYASLNPRMTVEAMLIEAMQVHRIGTSRTDRRERAAHLLEEVGLETLHLRRYPHEFSGGQRQRISIARALATEPQFIICDESVSALDVSVQAQVLNLLRDLQEKRGLTYVFISHDLSVVKFMSDMMAVMNEGKIVEFGPSDAIYANPKCDYTRNLISAIPDDSLEQIDARMKARAETRAKRVAKAAGA